MVSLFGSVSLLFCSVSIMSLLSLSTCSKLTVFCVTIDVIVDSNGGKLDSPLLLLVLCIVWSYGCVRFFVFLRLTPVSFLSCTIAFGVSFINVWLLPSFSAIIFVVVPEGQSTFVFCCCCSRFLFFVRLLPRLLFFW